jgi:predicted PurR-regulated permease PerM
MTEPRRKPDDGPLVPEGLQAAAGWSWRILVIAAAVTALGLLARKLELAVLPLLTAVLLTGLLQPINGRLRTLKLGRGASATITMLLAIALLGGVGVFVANRAAAGYPELVTQINDLISRTQHWLINGPLKLDKDSVNNVGQDITDYLDGRQGQIFKGALDAGRTAIEVLTALVLTFFLTIFLLYDGRNVFRWLTNGFPARLRPKADEVGERMWETVSGYVSGTFLVAIFHGLVMGITLAVVGVPLVAPLAVLIFIGGFIPLIGAVVFGGLAVLVTLVTNGTTASIIVLVVLLVENQVEGHVLQPFVVGRHVSLHPMAIALTLTAGAVVAGVPGAIFGVPLVAALNAAFKALMGEPPQHGGVEFDAEQPQKAAT